MALKASTGLRNYMLGNKDMRTALKDAVLHIYSGAAPATADDAATGTLLCTLTGAGATAKAKQKFTITPTVDSDDNSVWTVVLNGISFAFTDDGSATAKEVVEGLKAVIDAGNSGTVTNPAGVITIPSVYGLFTVTEDDTNLVIEAATAGVSFTCTATCTGSATGTVAVVETVANAYGLEFEAYSDIASGIIEKKSSQTWIGVCAASGTAGYYRLQLDTTVDTGGTSTSLPRLQGTISTANADMNMTSITKVAGATETVQSAQWTFPA